MHRYLPLIVILLLSLTGCEAKSKQQAVDEEAVRGEKHYAALVAGKESDGVRAAEARDWLDPKHKGNMLWKIDRKTTLGFVNDLYSAGADNVLAIYSPGDETIKVNMCASLLIVLPKDAQKRKAVFTAYNRIDKKIWGDDHTKEKDSGQRYLELNMDP